MSETTASPARSERPAPRANPWNVLLLVPLLMLVTPWFNMIEPRLLGMPYFYWIQFAWVPVGVICVAIVNRTTAARAARGEEAGR